MAAKRLSGPAGVLQWDGAATALVGSNLAKARWPRPRRSPSIPTWEGENDLGKVKMTWESENWPPTWEGENDLGKRELAANLGR